MSNHLNQAKLYWFWSNLFSTYFASFPIKHNLVCCDEILSFMNMAVGVAEFQAGGTKLQRFLHKNQHTQSKLLNFEFWINGELSKIGHHFSNKVI